MDSDTNSEELSIAVNTFQESLQQLILESFSNGVPLEDTWNITVPVADAPDWTVTIEKTYSTETSTYQPGFLEE